MHYCSDILLRVSISHWFEKLSRAQGVCCFVYRFALDWPLEVEIIILMTIQEPLS